MSESDYTATNRKRRKLPYGLAVDVEDGANSPATFVEPISPPPTKSMEVVGLQVSAEIGDIVDLAEISTSRQTLAVASPFQLTHVKGLPNHSNIDTLTLKDILGDPLIKRCWAFNYCFDVDFLMSAFDEDVRDQIDVTIIHGSWKKDSANRISIEEASVRYKNVKVVCAYMPEAFGTHHSKMVILSKHDDTAQVVILTANFLPQDFTMCQAVWRSPQLPQLPLDQYQSKLTVRPKEVGDRFKYDLLSYLKTYGSKLKDLMNHLHAYDFSAVRATLVASIPSKQNIRTTDLSKETLWGWPAVKQALSNVPVSDERSHIVAQCSSVATLGVTDSWLRGSLFRALSAHSPQSNKALSDQPATPKFSIVFPTADSIRRSIDGYACGGSIHMKTETAQQVKQLKYLRPMLCHWAGDGEAEGANPTSRPVQDAGRKRTGPHIKTYMRFADEDMTRLDWALVTSANMSKQAWGADMSNNGEVRICSYEIGVLVWPGLWQQEDREEAEMVPVFKRDTPGDESGDVKSAKHRDGRKKKTKIGIRMPYDLPLVAYHDTDMPWCASKADPQPDWLGRVWSGY